jgi:hypothetical protein
MRGVEGGKRVVVQVVSQERGEEKGRAVTVVMWRGVRTRWRRRRVVLMRGCIFCVVVARPFALLVWEWMGWEVEPGRRRAELKLAGWLCCW